MSELNSLHRDLEPNASPHSTIEKLGDAVREIYGKAAEFRLDEKNLAPEIATATALGAAAFLGWKTFLPDLAQNESVNLAADLVLERSTISPNVERLASQRSFSNMLEKQSANEMPKLSARLDEISQKLDPSYRYFEHTRGAGSTIYRWPDNGLPFQKQDDFAVERFLKNGEWAGGQRLRLRDELLKGWFDEKSDEISIQRALDIVKKTIKA